MTRIFLTLLLTNALTAFAMEPRTEHTFQLGEGQAAPSATLADVAWLSGSWTGTAFGQTFEEVWNPPSAGSMVGFFKLINEGQVSFYELLTLTEDQGRLSLRVKHFGADFTAWEEKSDFVDFKLVGIKEGELHFSGISFYRTSETTMEAYIVMRTEEGIHEEKLSYTRVP